MKTKKAKIRRCHECWCYQNPKVIRNYVTKHTTQEVSDSVGWRTCAYGCTVKALSVNSCFTLEEPGPIRRPRISI